MAANFWASSHCKRWLFTEADLEKKRVNLRGSFTIQDVEIINDYVLTMMYQMGKLLGFRQVVTSTAKLLYKRFYIKASLDQFDPRLLMVTAMYLAAKIEELGQYSLNNVLRKLREVCKRYKHHDFPVYTAQHVHDYEFYILEKLSFDLVVFHPHPYLVTYFHDAQLAETGRVLQDAWGIINDSYRTDVLLLYPPYLIALACLYISCVNNEVDVRQWYKRLNVRVDDIRDIAKIIMDAYKRRHELLRQRDTVSKPLLSKLAKKYKPMLDQQQREHRQREQKQGKSK